MIKVVSMKKSTQLEDWKPSEHGKRLTCIMMFCGRYQNVNILIAAHCSLNTVRPEIEYSDREYETVASR